MSQGPIFHHSYLNERGFNPIYAFFHTHQNTGLTAARVFLGLILLFHGLQHLFGLLESIESRHLLDDFVRQLDGDKKWLYSAFAWLELISAIFLMIGLFTRLIALLVLASIVYMMSMVWPVLTVFEVEFYLAQAALVFVVLLGGAGRYSLDGGISDQLLP